MYVSINYWKTVGGWQTKNLNQNRYPFTLPLGLVVHVSWRSGENLLQCMSLLIIGKLSEVDKERTSIESSILSPWQPLLTCCCSFKSTRFHYHALIMAFSKHAPSPGRAMAWIVPTSSHSVEIVLHSREPHSISKPRGVLWRNLSSDSSCCYTNVKLSILSFTSVRTLFSLLIISNVFRIFKVWTCRRTRRKFIRAENLANLKKKGEFDYVVHYFHLAIESLNYLISNLLS